MIIFLILLFLAIFLIGLGIGIIISMSYYEKRMIILSETIKQLEADKEEYYIWVGKEINDEKSNGKHKPKITL